MEDTYSVLIVDDNDEDRYLLRRLLKKTKLSLEILEAGGGRQGIDILTTPYDSLKPGYPDIRSPVSLFLDINMPEMNGWEFLEELERQQDSVQLNPTVVMMYSSSDDKYDKNKAKQFSAVSSYIVKGESKPEHFREVILSVNSVSASKTRKASQF